VPAHFNGGFTILILSSSTSILTTYSAPCLQIFTRILRNLNLPVGAHKMQVTRPHITFDIGTTSHWISVMMVRKPVFPPEMKGGVIEISI
jgi:hypothetical protein